jgi:hypothetical protein
VGFQTLVFRGAHHMFDIIPQPIPACLEAKLPLLDHSQALFPVSEVDVGDVFAIKKDFSKFEATSWAVQQLKHRGLNWLFKLVTSTAYECLVQSFYENLNMTATGQRFFPLPLMAKMSR